MESTVPIHHWLNEFSHGPTAANHTMPCVDSSLVVCARLVGSLVHDGHRWLLLLVVAFVTSALSHYVVWQ